MDEIFAHPQVSLTRRFVEPSPQRHPTPSRRGPRRQGRHGVRPSTRAGRHGRCCDVEKQFDVQAACCTPQMPLRHTTVGTMVLPDRPGAAVSHTLEWLAEQPGPPWRYSHDGTIRHPRDSAAVYRCRLETLYMVGSRCSSVRSPASPGIVAGDHPPPRAAPEPADLLGDQLRGQHRAFRSFPSSWWPSCR